MNVELNIDPKDLAQKIMDSLSSQAFSELFKKAVEDELNELAKKSYNSDSVIQRVVKNFFSNKMQEVLEEEYSDRAKEICRVHITDTKLTELAETFVKKIRLSDY